MYRRENNPYTSGVARCFSGDFDGSLLVVFTTSSDEPASGAPSGTGCRRLRKSADSATHARGDDRVSRQQRKGPGCPTHHGCFCASNCFHHPFVVTAVVYCTLVGARHRRRVGSIGRKAAPGDLYRTSAFYSMRQLSTCRLRPREESRHIAASIVVIPFSRHLVWSDTRRSGARVIAGDCRLMSCVDSTMTFRK